MNLVERLGEIADELVSAQNDCYNLQQTVKTLTLKLENKQQRIDDMLAGVSLETVRGLKLELARVNKLYGELLAQNRAPECVDNEAQRIRDAYERGRDGE